jgi:hypothetical protein
LTVTRLGSEGCFRLRELVLAREFRGPSDAGRRSVKQDQFLTVIEN